MPTYVSELLLTFAAIDKLGARSISVFEGPRAAVERRCLDP